MKKHLFYLAMVIMASGLFVACGGDDDDNNTDNKVTLTTAKYADEAVSFVIPEGNRKKVVSSDETVSLSRIDITESGMALIEVIKGGKKKYAQENVTINGNEYVLNGGKGRIVREVAASRAGVNLMLTINITIYVPGIGTVTFSTETNDPVGVIEKAATIASQASVNLARTWKVTGFIVDLKGDPDVYKEFNSGDLNALRAYIEDREYTFTDEEKEAFNRYIETITISNTGMVSIAYRDGRIDAAEWSWLNSQYETFKMKLIEEGMGNKFIPENTTVSVVFKNNLCNLTLSTHITGSETYDVSLTIKMQEK